MNYGGEVTFTRKVIPIQSEHVNTILTEILWSRGSYHGHAEAIVVTRKLSSHKHDYQAAST